ncbi:hypothetical protein V1478_002738 [Vespula squamosa]|uniref:Uncharacterized protein n=1 Tax=Vespula squamosa TaxID=30214 RepID=A0ABD2BSG6_VESSQ
MRSCLSKSVIITPILIADLNAIFDIFREKRFSTVVPLEICGKGEARILTTNFHMHTWLLKR